MNWVSFLSFCFFFCFFARKVSFLSHLHLKVCVFFLGKIKLCYYAPVSSLMLLSQFANAYLSCIYRNLPMHLSYIYRNSSEPLTCSAVETYDRPTTMLLTTNKAIFRCGLTMCLLSWRERESHYLLFLLFFFYCSDLQITSYL